MKTKKRGRKGRPRKFADGSIAFNLRLRSHAWAALKSRADAAGVPMADLARDAIEEWLLACAMGQRPVAGCAPSSAAVLRIQDHGVAHGGTGR